MDLYLRFLLLISALYLEGERCGPWASCSRLRQKANGGCDRSAEDTQFSMAPDSTSNFHRGGDCGTVQTSASVSGTLGSSVDLTCTYSVGPGDIVNSGSIAWQSKKPGTTDFENIALFSPPGEGSNSFTTTESAQNFKNRAELLNVTSIDSNTYRVVLRVLEVQCADEREYQCFVSFNNQNTGPQSDTAITSLIVQAPAEQPYETPAPLSSNIEENMNLSLSCTANVGKPPGKIKWWRYRDQINAPFFVAESSEIPAVQRGVCEYNVTFSIQPMVTKDDDQSVWRCSVDNELLTSSPDQDKPNQETAKINVFYKVDLPYITIFPNVTSSHYSIGSSVTLTCVAEGNPSPSTNIDKDINKYVWTFKANPGDNATELRSNNGVLNLNNLQETDTGKYTCTAFNGFNGKIFNTSKVEQLYIVNTSPVPTSTPTFTEGPTGNENTQPKTAGGDCGSVQPSASVSGTLGSSVDLTCTYTVGSGDRVYAGSIAWKSKKSGTSDFENIALFSPPGEGSNSFTTTESAQNYKDRAELLNVTSIDSNTYRVVLRVLEVQCSDEREYQCFVSFNNQNTGPQTDSAITSLTVQAPAEQPYEIPAPLSSDIEENMNLSLSCTANVGKPPGKIKWWRYRDQISAPFFVAESSEIPVVQPGVCEYNVTFSIQPMVTKDDDQSVWRCSVDNDLLTSSPDQDKPNQETARINVFYKVDLPYITIFPNVTSSHYSIGSSVTLTCVAEGNPSPSTNIDKDINKYVWTFKANPGDNATELRSNNGVLNLNNLQETDTGTYTCTASNGFNGKVFNTSKDEQLYIVNTSPVPTSTPTFTEGPTGNENTQPQTAEAITTTLPATTSTFVSPAGPAGNSDTEGRGSGDDGLSMGVTTVLMANVLLIVIAILVVFTVWYIKLQKESVSHVEGTNRDYSVFMDENNKPIMFHRNHMIVTNQYRNL